MEINLAAYIDHTLLKAFATEREVEKLCREAVRFGFHAVCVNGHFVPLCKEVLGAENSGVRLAAVAGFPLGAGTTEAKHFEVKQLLRLGADEIDLVVNVGWLKDGKYDKCARELDLMRSVSPNAVLKLIVECCYLSEMEKIAACKLCVDTGMDYIKTSTGFGIGGAKVEDVLLFKQELQGKVKIKASGGIRTKAFAMSLIEAGADRLGTSHGLEMLESSTRPKEDA